jgi:hypothetical protein
MKKLFYLFVLLTSILFASCISASSSNLLGNGDYLDDGITHTISVRKLNVLYEFGITQEEWNSCLKGLSIYHAFSSGNAYASRAEVEKRAYDAIEVVAKDHYSKYAAIIGKNTDVHQYINSYTTYVNSQVYGSNGYRATISTPQRNYYNVEKCTFECYVIFFDSESKIKTIRDVFGNINIIQFR